MKPDDARPRIYGNRRFKRGRTVELRFCANATTRATACLKTQTRATPRRRMWVTTSDPDVLGSIPTNRRQKVVTQIPVTNPTSSPWT